MIERAHTVAGRRSLFVLALAVLSWLATTPRAAVGEDPEPSFPVRIVPILTKAGCNTGACHGAAVGQGGFKLSLLGYDPRHDYAAITREFMGRRIDLDAVEQSLLLLKPTVQIDHDGGERLRKNSADYRALLAWIAKGAAYGQDLRVTRIEVEPSDLLFAVTGTSQPLTVRATLSDGGKEDVTAHALFSSNDDAIAEASQDGVVTIKHRGNTAIMVRYGGQVAAIRAGLPFQSEPLASVAFEPANFIDEAALKEWRRLRIPPSALSGDAEFLRRVSLDVAGKLPSGAEVEAFLADQSPAKRAVAVEGLLASAEFVDFWTLKFSDLLQINSKKLGEAPARAYSAWLRGQFEQNAGLDQIVRQLLVAVGNPGQNGPANFARLANDPRDMGEFVSRAFLGQRLACARCHNHPLDRWTTRDYYGFAAFFAQTALERGQVVVKPAGEVPYPKTGESVAPRLLGGPEAGPNSPGDRRIVLADWMAAPENPYFARAMANRVWKEMFGRGLVEPADDLRASNPPSNPALLEALAAEFVRSGFDLRQLIRAMALSHTYQLSSQTNPVNQADEQFFSHAYPKPLRAQVLADAIAQATGIPDSYPGYPPGTRAVQLLDATVPSYTLDVFGRCSRLTDCDPLLAGGGLAATLHLLNGPPISGRVAGVIESWLREPVADAELIKSSYRRTLSRNPTVEELALWTEKLRGVSSKAEWFEDLLWGLLNSREFAFNH